MSASSSQLTRKVLVLMLVIVLLSGHIDDSRAAIYRPPNQPRKKQVQDLKVLFSNIHSLMFCRDCEDPLSEGSIGGFFQCCWLAIAA